MSTRYGILHPEKGAFHTMKEIYLDNAAATPISPVAQRAMKKTSVLFGNPSALHRHGRYAAQALLQARQKTADFLGAQPEHIVFTASASEANTMAVLRLAEANPKRKHIITTPIEHKSILQACDVLKKRGYSISMVPVDGQGRVDPDEVVGLIRKNTLLVSVMYANNEIGSIGRKLRRIRRKQGGAFPLFHTDACQAAAYLPMDVHQLEVDLLTFNSSKVYGPRGIGVLYVHPGVDLAPQVYGGPHEKGLRAGTENVPALVGFAEVLGEVKKGDGDKIARLRDWAIDAILRAVPDARLNGPSGEERFANNINISIPGVTGEQMVLELDTRGISISTGAACTSHETGPSHVIKAIRVPRKYREAVRISLGRTTKRTDMAQLIKVLPNVVEKLRRRNRYTA